MNPREVNDWAASSGMLNGLYEYFGSGSASTYISGQNATCIDYVLISEGIYSAGAVTSYWIYRENIWYSDHYAVGVRINMYALKLLGSEKRDYGVVKRRNSRFKLGSKYMEVKLHQEILERWYMYLGGLETRIAGLSGLGQQSSEAMKEVGALIDETTRILVSFSLESWMLP